MVAFYKKYRKNIFQLGLICLISGLGIFALAGGVQAEEYGPIEQGFVNLIGKFFLLIMEFFGILIAWVVGLIKGVMEFGNPQDASVVRIGWTIVRDITNMFFILALLVIAFATILRRETYGMKALLPKLIGIALLINFSLALAGVVIGFANGLTAVFLQDDKLFSQDLPRALKINAYIDNTAKMDEVDKAKIVWECKAGEYEYDPGEFSDPITIYTINEIALSEKACEAAADGKCAGHCEEKTITTGDAEILKEKLAKTDYTYNMILAMFLSNIFLIIAIFCLAALFFMLIYRVLVLWFLLILMPIALFLWILPAAANMFSKWVYKFLKWTFFGPIVTFFIWLSIMSWIRFLTGEAEAPGGAISVGMGDIAKHEMLANQAMPKMFLPENLFQFILVCGMLIGSLVVAQKLSIYGAGGAMALGKKWAGGVGSGLYKGVRFGKRKAEEYSARRGVEGKFQTGLQKTIGRVPGVRRALRPGREQLEAQRAKVAEARKKYESWSNDHIYSEWKTADTYGKVALAQILAQRGKLTPNQKLGFTDKDIKNSAAYAYSFGTEGDILKARPELAMGLSNKMGKTKQEAVNDVVKKLKAGEFGNIEKKSLDVPEVEQAVLKQFQKGGNFGKNHLIELNKSNVQISNTIQDEMLEEKYDSLREDVKKHLDKAKGREPLERLKGSIVDDVVKALRKEGAKDYLAIGKMMDSFKPEDTGELSRRLSEGDISDDLSKTIVDRFTDAGGWRASHRSSLEDSNPALYQKIKEELRQSFEKLKPDVKESLIPKTNQSNGNVVDLR